MANKHVNEEITEDEEAPKKGKKGLIIIILAVLLLGGAGAGLFFSGMLDSLLGKEETKEAVKEGEETKAEVNADEKKEGKEGDAKAEGVVQPVYYDLPEIIANLNPGSSSTSFIKAKMTIEAPNEQVRTKIQAAQPKIMDAINTYIREMRPSDLKGSAGIYRLREELILRINKALYPDQINNILFTELVIQ